MRCQIPIISIIKLIQIQVSQMFFKKKISCDEFADLLIHFSVNTQHAAIGKLQNGVQELGEDFDIIKNGPNIVAFGALWFCSTIQVIEKLNNDEKFPIISDFFWDKIKEMYSGDSVALDYQNEFSDIAKTIQENLSVINDENISKTTKLILKFILKSSFKDNKFVQSNTDELYIYLIMDFGSCHNMASKAFSKFIISV